MEAAGLLYFDSVSYPSEATHESDREVQWYDAIRRLLISKARRMNSPDPEGATSEVISRALSNPKVREAMEIAMGRARNMSAGTPEWLSHWLLRCLRFVVYEQWRIPPPVSLDGELLDISAAAGGVLEQLLHSEAVRIVSECRSCLKESERRTLELQAQGLSKREIAIRMQTNEDTVHRRIAHSIDKLRRCVARRFSKPAGIPHA